MDKKILEAMENGELPGDIQAKLSSLMELYKQMSDEEKEDFKKGAFDVLKNTLKESRVTSHAFLPTWLAAYQSNILFIFAISVVILLFVIFTLNLYWRTKERDYRKEMKKKAKEQRTGKKKI